MEGQHPDLETGALGCSYFSASFFARSWRCISSVFVPWCSSCTVGVVSGVLAPLTGTSVNGVGEGVMFAVGDLVRVGATEVVREMGWRRNVKCGGRRVRRA